MALNLADRVTIRGAILPRVTGAVVKYALYLLNGAPTVQQKNWAIDAIRTPAAMADRVSWYLLDNTDFLADGSGMVDAALTGATETAINTHLIPTYPS